MDWSPTGRTKYDVSGVSRLAAATYHALNAVCERAREAGASVGLGSMSGEVRSTETGATLVVEKREGTHDDAERATGGVDGRRVADVAELGDAEEEEGDCEEPSGSVRVRGLEEGRGWTHS